MKHAKAWSDGGNRETVAACACHIVVDGSVEYKRSRKLPGGTTNMVAEYEGVILAMDVALKLGITNLKIFVDNQTVERHLRGIYKVKSGDMKPLYKRCIELGEKFDHVSIKWIPRELNTVADRLCRREMDGKKPARRKRPGGQLPIEDKPHYPAPPPWLLRQLEKEKREKRLSRRS